MGVKFLTGAMKSADIDDLKENDVAIIPAFGAEIATMNKLKAKGCQLVDTTCGDVMSVWKRVTQNVKESFTSIIHGKAKHEETMATSSRATAVQGGHYLVVLNLPETDYVCNYIRHGGSKDEFSRNSQAHTRRDSIPTDLASVGVAKTRRRCCQQTEGNPAATSPSNDRQVWLRNHRPALSGCSIDLRRDTGATGR
jgi:4-hydroxy-3-methylbut-2-enyl diphosphate reductase